MQFLGGNKRKALINNFVLSNSNQFVLDWMLPSAKSANKIEAIPKRALPFICNMQVLNEI